MMHRPSVPQLDNGGCDKVTVVRKWHPETETNQNKHSWATLQIAFTSNNPTNGFYVYPNTAHQEYFLSTSLSTFQFYHSMKWATWAPSQVSSILCPSNAQLEFPDSWSAQFDSHKPQRIVVKNDWAPHQGAAKAIALLQLCSPVAQGQGTAGTWHGSGWPGRYG